MGEVIFRNNRAFVMDERWVTIGGEDNDGSGHHVLIKENGTITAGFGKGRNVKNAFGGSQKSSDNKHEAKSHEATAKKSSDIQVDGKQKQAILEDMREHRRIEEEARRISEQIDRENQENGVKHYTDYRPSYMRIINLKKVGDNEVDVTLDIEFEDTGIGKKNNPIRKTITVRRENLFGAVERTNYGLELD